MSKQQYLIAANHLWHPAMIENLNGMGLGEFALIENPADLTVDALAAMQPTKIFFPHWSSIIPAKIYEQYECIIFHMTDVPFGRGGSPLQNLIARGIKETKLTALRCVKALDAGPVYLKRPLSLQGSAQDIFRFAASLIEQMIGQIIQDEITPTPQEGEATCFSRRKPAQSNVNTVESIEQLYDLIRMMDAPGYPPAFLETEHFRLEFKRGSFENKTLLADVVIKDKTHD